MLHDRLSENKFLDKRVTESERYEIFERLMLSLGAQDTSAHPNEWTVNNSLLGHCSVVSLLAQDVFGGEILRVDLRNTSGFEHIKWHSWNKMPNGTEFDFTRSQLEKPIPQFVPVETRSREELFSYPGIKDRYLLIKSRFNTLLASFSEEK